ncbi:MAG: hypothetical protein WAV76_15750 [Bacteroidota bacterium]
MQHTHAVTRKTLQLSLISLAVISSFLLASCTAVGLIAGGYNQTYTGKYSIQLTNQYPDLFDTITAVGESMGFNASIIDAPNNMISIGNGGSVASGFVGSQNLQTIIVKSMEGGKQLDIDIQVQGNFGHGTKKAADDLFSEFKTKLLEKVN